MGRTPHDSELRALRSRISELESDLAVSRAASEARLGPMFETISDGILITNADGRIRQVNRAAWTMFGCTKAEDLVGRHTLSFIVPAERERAMESFARVLEESRVFNSEHMVLPLDGEPFPVEINGGLLTDPSGGPVGVIGIVKDIRERRNLEDERQRAAKLESVGVLAGGIAHDFNNLLMSVGASLALAARETVCPDVRRRLESALKGIRGGEKLTSQLLVFSEGGDPVKRAVCLEALLRDCATASERRSGTRIEVRVEPALWPVLCDSGQIWQVIRNLVLNGTQAMPEGGDIEVSARNVEVDEGTVPGLAGGLYVRISVKDQGVGIPEKHRSRVFDPYFSTRPGGSGLGLAASYTIIKKHGGAIAVGETGPEGTTMWVHLPAHPDSEISETGTLQGGAEERRGSVLLMDDDEAVAEAVRDMLEMIGFTCRITNDGLDAVNAYRRRLDLGRPYDAVIMDLTVPGGMGGVEAARRILDCHPEAVALVSSGYSNDPAMANPDVYGFRGVLAKPYPIEELDRVLTEVLGGPD